MSKLVSRGLRLFMVFGLLLILVSAAHAAPGDYLLEWGAKFHFLGPWGVATDRHGNVYVPDSGANRIQKLTGSGKFVTSWGTKGSGDGQFLNPMGVTVDGSGRVYVADTGNNRIQKFEYDRSSHRYVMVKKWGELGAREGDFNGPQGVAVDRAGNVFVADSGNNRIQKFDGTGKFLAAWGSAGMDNGQFYNPTGLAIDSSGKVYVADSGNNRVQIFSYDGTIHRYTFHDAWGGNGPGTGNNEFDVPRGVAIDSHGYVYVTDPGNYRIQKFTSTGRYLLTFEGAGIGLGEHYNPAGVAVDGQGDVYVTDPFYDRIQKFEARTGSLETNWESFGDGPGRLHWPSGMAADAAGNVYLTDFNNRIQVFDAFGNFKRAWGTFGNGNGELNSPSGLAVDSSGNLYVADTQNYRVQKFDSAGNFLLTWGSAGMGPGYFNAFLYGVAVDKAGNVYTVDYNGVQKFDGNGTFLAIWGGRGTGAGEFIDPSGIAVGKSGNVYVVDAGNNRIQKFDSSGTFLLSWGSQGSGNGEFSAPSGIAADDAGHLFVVDTGNSRVQVFDEDGNFLASWGRYGSGKRQFIYLDYPYFQGLAVNPAGTVVYVADTTNNRVQALAGYATPTLVFTAGPHGAVVGSTQQTVSFGGSTKPVTAIARPGYRFRDWTDAAGNVVSRDNPLVLTKVAGSMELTANFEPRCQREGRVE